MFIKSLIVDGHQSAERHQNGVSALVWRRDERWLRGGVLASTERNAEARCWWAKASLLPKTTRVLRKFVIDNADVMFDLIGLSYYHSCSLTS